jgi:hypothetical protein
MADLEVENTLREIRERVLAEAQRRAPETAASSSSSAPALNAAAGGESGGAGVYAGEALARMDANLATTARAWSRLPPVLSYRRGATARLELRLKRLIARAAHWFTWEQVNFNSAVHHALGDARAALAALDAHGQALTRLQSEIVAALRAGAEADRARVAELESHAAELQSRLSQAEARFESGGAQLRQAFAAGLERLAEAQRAAEELRESQRAEIGARAEELHAELRGRLDGLLEEQRVCFKQLSLEAGEAAVMHDRARRQLEARLEALEGSRQ